MNQISHEQSQGIKQMMLQWFKSSKGSRKQFSWDNNSNYGIFYKILPLFYPEFNITELGISVYEINQMLCHLISTVFKIQEIAQSESMLFNTSEKFIFILQGSGIGQIQANSTLGLLFTSFTQICTNQSKKVQNFSKIMKQISQMKRVQPLPYQSWRKITIGSYRQKLKIITADRAIMDRFKLDLLAIDYDRKIKFITSYLFCNIPISFNVKMLKMQDYKRGDLIQIKEQKIYLLYQGALTLVVENQTKNQTNNETFNRFNQIKGSILSINQIKDSLKECGFLQDKDDYDLMQIKFYAIQNCRIITMPQIQFVKFLKADQKLKAAIFDKISCLMTNRSLIIKKGIIAKQMIKFDDQNSHIDIKCTISNGNGKKNSKAFRCKRSTQNSEYQEFMTFNRFQIMTQNKEEVQKKHNQFNQLSQFVKRKKQQQRYLKTIKLQEGFKQIKRKQLSARLKKTKIDNMAIRSCINNAKKYEEKTKDIQFYFQEVKSKKTALTTYKRWLSMQQMQEQQFSRQSSKQNLNPCSNIKFASCFKSSSLKLKSNMHKRNFSVKGGQNPHRCSIAEMS